MADGHTVVSVLRGAEQWLQARAVAAPRRAAELLLGRVLGLKRLDLYLAHDRPLDEGERAAMRDLIARHARGEPVAHLLGGWSFRGLDLEVGPAVLVPRPETEELLSAALPQVPAGARVVDLGTGSGALAIALAAERPDVSVLATDLSADALAVAARNVARHGLGDRVRLRQGDWWQACAGEAPFDVVLSNPPYVDRARTDLIEPAVAAHEPALALFAADGDVLSCYRRILAGIETWLVPGGSLWLETGVEAADGALALLQAHASLGDAALANDLAGLPRFLSARRLPVTAMRR